MPSCCYSYIDVISSRNEDDCEDYVPGQLREVLVRIEHAVMAILMILIEQAQIEDPNDPTKSRSLDYFLLKAGYTQTQVADIMGKSKQAVSSRLRNEGVT